MTLQLYVLRQVLVGLVFAVGGMAVAAIPGIAVKAVQMLEGGNLRLMLGYLPLAASELIPYLVPVGFLLAVVATYGRLAADREWTAICMAGIRPARMLLPPLGLAIVLGVATLWILSNVNPELQMDQRNYVRRAAIETFKELNPGRTELSLRGFHLFSQRRSPEGVFEDVIIHVPASGERQERTVWADGARFRFEDHEMLIELFEPHTVLRQGGFADDWTVGHNEIRIDLDELPESALRKPSNPRFHTSAAIWSALQAGGLDPFEERRYSYTLHRRIAIAATYLVFLLLGVPTGLILRRGTQLGALSAAVAYALLYYLVSMHVGKSLVFKSGFPPMIAAWAANGLGLLVAPWLLRKALRR